MEQQMTSHQKIAKHLTEQRALSVHHGLCKYRGGGGLMCAVGAIIPDDQYKSTMEHRGAQALFGMHPHLLPDDITVTALEAWQEYHDSYLNCRDLYSYEDWIKYGDPANSPQAVAEVISREFGVM